MGVISIVTGHYLSEGGQLAITLEAVDVGSNRTIWRDQLQVPADDALAMRERVTSTVRQGLVPALGGAYVLGESGTRPNNQQAYDLYLRSLAVSRDATPNKQAIAMLQHVVALDSTRPGRLWEPVITLTLSTEAVARRCISARFLPTNALWLSTRI
jgi:hypothetical protein